MPPNDFTAFDRMELGWVVKPIVVDTTSSGLVIESANSHLFAVKLPTALATGRGPELTDLLYTGNPVMRLPMALRPYHSNDVAYTIDRVVSNHNDAVLLDTTARSMPRVPNEVTNSSFETSSSPWTYDGWKPGSATFSWANGVGHESAHSLSISSSIPNDVEWRTTVTGLTSGVPHALCGYLRGQNIVPDQGSTRGASMSISGTFIHSPSGVGTFDWAPFCTMLTPDSTSTTIACRLGGFGALASGTMWCDDVAVIPPLRSAF